MTTNSMVAPAEFAGLIKNLLLNFNGKKGRLWLEALKRFLKMENPWIPMRKILKVSERIHTGTSIRSQINRLKALHIDTENLEEVEAIGGSEAAFLLEAPIKQEGIDLPAHHVVMIIPEDLLTAEERRTFTYEQMLQKAHDVFGLDRCSLTPGLDACIVLIEETQKIAQEPIVLAICTEPFKSDVPRIILINSQVRPITPDSKEWGVATLYDIKDVPNSRFKGLRLLLRAIPW